MLSSSELFTNLMALTESSEAFFYADQTLGNTNYRIFNYRLASYTEFSKPSALECRGVLFELDSVGQFVRLACRPMEKFFNLNEVPTCINTLAMVLVSQGRLSQDVFERSKRKREEQATTNGQQIN